MAASDSYVGEGLSATVNEQGDLVITVPAVQLQKTDGKVSSTGKTRSVASTNGPRRVHGMPEAVRFDVKIYSRVDAEKK